MSAFSPTDRAVLHADLDTFFVSVERVLDPRLNDRPVIVGGSPTGRGVVSACSYETRRYGVRSGMALRRAYRLCPDAVFLRGTFGAYATYSRRVAALLRDVAPVVEKASVDEFYLDLSGCRELFGDLYAWSHALKQRIYEEIGLPISMGLASNKLVAKVATSTFKGGTSRGRVAMVIPGTEARFLAPLPVERLPGVGPRTTETLHRLGLYRLYDVQHASERLLKARLGRYGPGLIRRARGQCTRPVAPHRVAKSVGHERTFRTDTLDRRLIWAMLRSLTERTGHDLRVMHRCATRLVFKLRYSDFQTVSHTRRFPPTCDDLVLDHHARLAFDTLLRRPLQVRLIGIRAEGLVSMTPQIDLFDDTSVRRLRVLRAFDDVKQRYGFGVVQSARALEVQNRRLNCI